MWVASSRSCAYAQREVLRDQESGREAVRKEVVYVENWTSSEGSEQHGQQFKIVFAVPWGDDLYVRRWGNGSPLATLS